MSDVPQTNLNTQAYISMQANGGGGSASSQPATMGSMNQSALEIGANMQEGIVLGEYKFSLKDGPLSGDITSAIDQGSMMQAIGGKLPINPVVHDSPGMSAQFAAPQVFDPSKTAGAFTQGRGGGGGGH
jgi:hypothetical protein